MVDSQFALNAIPIAGIVVGCLGGLFLAHGLLGKGGNFILRCFIVGAAVSAVNTCIYVFNPLDLQSAGLVGFGIPLQNFEGIRGLFLVAGIGFLFGCIIAPFGLLSIGLVLTRLQRSSVPGRHRAKVALWLYPVSVAVGFLLGFFIINHSVLYSIEFGLATLIGMYLLLGSFVLANVMSARQLQLFGLLLTFLGGVAQAIPNLLNIINN